MYHSILKPLLFLLPPERAHAVTVSLLRFVLGIPGMPWLFRQTYVVKHPSLERECFGLKFSNPVGLAAGFDKNAELIDDFTHLGFGFIEVGTVTPKPQGGNPQPRLFRLPQDDALINRMGFNNHGVEQMVHRLKSRKSKILIGGNIGKNKVTPNEEAHEDYIKCFDALFPWVDYFVVNVSSPNTPNLRALQDREPLEKLLLSLKSAAKEKKEKKPILLKIAPDLSNEQLDEIVELATSIPLDGVIATNTTISREDLTTSKRRVQSIGAGGLSGKPLTDRATEVIRHLHKKSGGKLPIIGVGGIFSAQDAVDKLQAGACLVQIYTGLVYEGPGLIKRINKELINRKN